MCYRLTRGLAYLDRLFPLVPSLGGLEQGTALGLCSVFNHRCLPGPTGCGYLQKPWEPEWARLLWCGKGGRLQFASSPQTDPRLAHFQSWGEGSKGATWAEGVGEHWLAESSMPSAFTLDV